MHHPISTIDRGLRSLRDVLWENSRLYLVMEYMDTDLLHFCREAPLDLPTIKVRRAPPSPSQRLSLGYSDFQPAL